MDKDSCFQLGYIAKVHGLHGEVVIQLDVDDPGQYEDLERVFVARHSRLVPYFLDHFVLQPRQRVLAKFEDFNHVDEAATLVGAELYLPLNDLPELPEDQYYYHELVGLAVHDEVHGELGVVKHIYDLHSQELIGLDYRGKEILIPIKDEIVLKVDKTEKKILCRLPEGLLDIYLED